MKVVFTGSSSFTGLWFLKELITHGHKVTALFRNARESYEGLRAARVDKVCEIVHQAIFDCPFGASPFLNLLKTSPWDILCHHGAEATNYKSADFDLLAAVKSNTHGLQEVLKNEIGKVVLTDSVFAPGEGAGSDDLPAVSPYGLSKGLTTQIFQFYCCQARVPLHRFVIPNPFGPYEEPRFVSYVMRQWLQGAIAEVRYPLYVRDNIPISLLAKCYAEFCEGTEKLIRPSGYIDSQGDFTKRLASEMRKRLGIACEYVCAQQTEFLEPAVRVNTDAIRPIDWNEEQSWDELAAYYQQRHLMERVSI